jgi:glycosyltransferase involved in cell wall biosynthesis
MRLSYITEYEASEINNWSGLGYYIARALAQQGFELDYIGKLKSSLFYRLYGKSKRLVYWFANKKYLRGRDPGLAKIYAAQIHEHPAFSNADIVFSPGSIPISYLDCPQPVVFWADATFAGMLDFYPQYSSLCAESVRNGNMLEQSALDRCRLAIYGSDWAAQSALENYRVAADKVRVVPFGANINKDYSLDEIKSMINARSRSVCKLLFVGVDWMRKGGDIALQVAGQIHDRGISVELAIVGCIPPVRLSHYVKSYGFLSKSSRNGATRLNQLFAESHFLIVPSRAEAYGLVFAEASAYGVPALATNVGGIPTIIHDGKNGSTFALDAPAAEYANFIDRLWSRPDEYYQLALSSYAAYREGLNWQSAGKAVKALLEACCS